MTYITDKVLKNQDFSENGLEQADYESCNFIDCIFSSANLSSYSFEDCSFENCDFSNTKITNTAFKNVSFKNCKLIGLQFDECNPFLLEFNFNGCMLNYASFYQLKIKETRFNRCIMHEVDFSETDLSKAIFSECDLAGAVFNFTNLQKADLRNSINLYLNPEQNKLAGAHFSLDMLPGLLSKYNIEVD